jgi:hypothetical protein
VNLTYNGSAGAPTNAGSYTVVATVTEANHTGFANNVLTVAKASLTATADDKSREYAKPNPPFTISYFGFVNSDGISVLDSLPTATTTATLTSLPGSYSITLTGGGDDNYAFNLVNGTLRVVGGAPTILSITGAGTTNLVITWSASSNLTYRAQYRPDLNTEWSNLLPDVIATNGTASAVDGSGGVSQRFYRVLLLQ